MRAEAHESLTARTGRMFDDLHLVWIAMAATVATFLCGAVALSALHFASPERDDSLAAMINVISAPTGSNLNPVRADAFLQFPSVPERGAIEAMLARPVSREELTLALSAVVTREGRVAGVSVLDDGAVAAGCELDSGRAGEEPARAGAGWHVGGGGEPRVAADAHDGPAEGSRPGDLREPGRPPGAGYLRTSVTAVATLFIASVARMITLRPVSPSSSVTSNSSRRESGMPSFG